MKTSGRRGSGAQERFGPPLYLAPGGPAAPASLRGGDVPPHAVPRALRRSPRDLCGLTMSDQALAHHLGLATVHLAAPVELVDAAVFEEAREVLGRVVGVDLGQRGASKVRLRLHDGGTIETECHHDLAAAAAKLFNKNVEASVVYEVDSEAAVERKVLERLEPSSFDPTDDDPLALFEEFRRENRELGVKVRASEWLEELFEED